MKTPFQQDFPRTGDALRPILDGARRSAAITVMALACAGFTGCSKDSPGPATALAASKIDAIAAVKAVRASDESAWPIELELELNGTQPIYLVEARFGFEVREVRVDAVTGAILGTTPVDLSEKEEYTLKRLDTIESGKRSGLAKALRAALDQTPGGQVFEADLDLAEDQAIYAIQLLVGEEKKKVEIPVAGTAAD